MGGANCPETPRQKMIGMMYLVLTALLALNVSKDILNAFVIVDNGLRKTSPIVTATFEIKNVNSQQILDMEILLPIDRAIEPSGEYRFKKVFHLVNAVYAQHRGSPALLQDTYNQMIAYIQENKLQQITAAYNVNVSELQSSQSMDKMVIDVYIGVNPSLL